jgi:putative GTP pyrophosphokinase
MGQEERSSEQWGEVYAERRPAHVSFTGALDVLLRQLLDQASIPYAQVESRTKETANFVGKLKRKNEKYADPLTEVTDLSGLRIILFYLDDVERVGELITQQFEVDAEHSGDKSVALDPDRFGYLSVHHVIRLDSSRKELLEWKRFDGYCAEIQVRTVLQHAWAAISRKLAYASVREAPRDLQRNLNRLSALLELADDEFVDIRAAREEIEAEYDRELERGNLDLGVDESSLAIYLRETGIGEEIERFAREADSPSAADAVAELEKDEYERLRRDLFRRLLNAVERAGLERISDLDRLLKGHWESIPRFIQTVNERFAEDGEPLVDDSDNWLTLVVLWAMQAPAEVFDELDYMDELAEAVVSTYGED